MKRLNAASRYNILGALLVVALGAVLRICRLGEESLWIDEGYSLNAASQVTSLTDVRAFYFLLLRVWMTFGQSEAWLRLLAVIFGIASVWLIYQLAMRLFGHKVGMISALIMAVSPLHINHSQEIRMYSLVTMVVLAEALLFTRFAETGRARDMLLCLAMAGLAFLVFPLTVLMLPVFSLFLLLRIRQYRPHFVKWFAGLAVSGIAAIPVIPNLASATRGFGEAWTWRISEPGVRAVLELTRDFNLWRIPSSHGKAVMAGDIYGILILLLAAYGVWRFYRERPEQTQFVLIWLAVPVLVTAVVSHTLVNIWMVRYMIYASPAYYMLMALGIASVGRTGVQIAVLLAVLSLPLARLGVYYTESNRPEWRAAVGYVQQNLDDNDIIGVYRYGNKYVFDYYYSGHVPFVALGPSELSRDSFGGWTDERIDQIMSDLPGDSDRIWFVLSWHENTGGFSIENYIRDHFRVLEMKDFRMVRVYLADRQMPVISERGDHGQIE